MKRAAIDIGGTFTDCIILDEAGEIRTFKSPTTPRNPAEGLLNALEKAARFYQQPFDAFLGELELIIHGTTLATNALLQGRGVKTGMLTTENFRDTIQLRRGYKNVRTSMYNVFVPPYEPLVPRYLRLGVPERTLVTGEILTPLDEDATRQAVAQLKAEGVEAIAICFLHSYANPTNEKRALEISRESANGLYVTASQEILPVWREYERFSTTVVSAYIGPIVADYLKRLERGLGEAGFRGTLLMMLSSGLVESVDYCIPRAVLLIGSGPAAAPSAGLFVGETVGERNLLSVDMGGTSFDVCMLRNGEIPTTSESWVGDERVAVKMIDVHSGGAGGGSIAWIDPLGLVRVGPQSAGAEPGPAAYGKGGTEPTVTDANVVLGYVPADFFLGGEIPLDAELALEAVRKIAEPMQMSIPQAAEAIHAAVNASMADQVAAVTTKRGYDVRDFALVVGGGAGAVHGAAIADLLGMHTVVVPPVAALYSAFGMFAMDLGRDFARSWITRVDGADLQQVSALYEEMERDGREALRAMGAADASIVFKRSVDMRYVGQFHEVEVEVPSGPVTPEAVSTVLERFHQRHQELFTFRMDWKKVEFLTFRVKVIVPRAPFQLREIATGGADTTPAFKRRRACVFGGREVDTAVYDGERLLAGSVVQGPAIIEEQTTTVVIPEGFRCTVDAYKNYMLRK
jgi:N-methylhydantoinase A